MSELGWIDRLRVFFCPGSALLLQSRGNLYELLQGRLGNVTVPANSSSSSDAGRSYRSLEAPLVREDNAALKMDPESSEYMSNSYSWVPSQLHDSLSCLYSNHLPEAADTHFPFKSPDQAYPQIQALRDVMSYGSISSQTVPSPHLPSVNYRVAPPSLYPLDETPDSLVGANYLQLSQSKQEMLAYQALCTDMYGTERSPHRSQFQRENHILAERQRREEMNEKFSALRAMIPKGTKKDKASIVGDTINYVLELEKRLKHLQACKDKKGYFKPSKRKTTPAAIHTFDEFDRPAACNTIAETPLGPSTDDSVQQPVQKAKAREESGLSSQCEQMRKDFKLRKKKPAEVDVHNLGSQAVIKLVCSRSPGQVLRVLHALDECKVDVIQSNVTTVGEHSVHFVTVQLEAGVSVSTEELISALLLAACPD